MAAVARATGRAGSLDDALYRLHHEFDREPIEKSARDMLDSYRG